MSIGDKVALASARILAGMGYDCLTDPALREAASKNVRMVRGEA